MTQEDYILNRAKNLKKMIVKRRKLNERIHLFEQMSDKAWQKLNAELHWLSMEIEKEKERIGFVLGHLTLFELQDEYNPSGWHRYEGIKGEMQNLKLER